MLHMQLWDDRLSGDDLQNYKDLVAFFYTNIKGETAKERCTCQEKVDSKKNIYQKPRSVLN